jgi:hypothetical protein
MSIKFNSVVLSALTFTFTLWSASSISQTTPYEAPPILEEQDLLQYLTSHGRADNGSPDDPLSYLSMPARIAFLESLSFGRYGLGSFNYAILENDNLTATEAYLVLSLFDVERVTRRFEGLRIETELDRDIMKPVLTPVHHGSEDIEGYECPSPGNCKVRLQYICLVHSC